MLNERGERVIRSLASSLGVDARVIPNEIDHCITVRLTLPGMVVRLSIDQDTLALATRQAAAELLYKQLVSGQRELFADIAKHMAEHDKSPHERLRDVEQAAAALLTALDGLEARLPYNHATPIQSAAWKLRELLRMNPGKVTWSSRG